MGWASGSDIAVEMAEAIKKHVRDVNTETLLYKALINALESHDWDTQNEAMGIDHILDKLLES